MKQVLNQDQNMVMPLTKEQLEYLQSALKNFTRIQLVWISGYLYGLSNIKESVRLDLGSEREQTTVLQNIKKITLISASQTGNARRLSEQLRDDLIQINKEVDLFNAGDYKFKKISKVRLLILITSTYGEGEPPEEAVALYKYLFSNKALSMNETYFAVFSFGDRSYEYFAKAGKDFDDRLEELGAHRVCDRVDVDLDFRKEADAWRNKIIALLSEKISAHSMLYHDRNMSKIAQVNCTNFCKESPFIAQLSVRQKITSCDSLKDVHHLEIDISGSNISYQPGDALGVWYENDPDLISEFLKLLHLTGNEKVYMNKVFIPLKEALQKYCELTHNTSIVVKKMSHISQNKKLISLFENQERLNKFIATTPIVDMIRQTSVKLTPPDLLKILCPLKPRFYSISSSQAEVGSEIHITVSVIRYKVQNRIRTGGASSYLVDRLKEHDALRIFVEPNNNFRLPKDSNIPIIMIGAGTGIAPFRAFIQQRASDGASGKSWLFFGNLRFTDDFLYQTEWQQYIAQGFLSKIDTAWSRDQENKIYVQDKLLENSMEIWSWIQEGAYVYVCGDARSMAQDVEQALFVLTSKYGDMDLDKVSDFWNEMRIQRRYQRDVY